MVTNHDEFNENNNNKSLKKLPIQVDIHISIYAAHLYDSVVLYAQVRETICLGSRLHSLGNMFGF